MHKPTIHTVLILAVLTFFVVMPVEQSVAASQPKGGLTIIEPDGKPGAGCPLEHTSVKADISGFAARVEVRQVFHNPRKEKIEAVYTFPLSAHAAVDEMVMRVGKRVVRGIVKRREEARRIYEQARDKGHVASLLDQERPNIFTQSVANIMPGEKVEITIKYVEILTYEDGQFSFAFPMVVAPRFIPGRPTGRKGNGWAPDTSTVPDGSRITPPVVEEGKRAGHDIDLTVSIDAGVPIEKAESKLHEVQIDRKGPSRIVVSLKNKKEIPNKDFVLHYQVGAKHIQSGVLAHKDDQSGYVTILMIAPKRVEPQHIAPRELIFVVDTSGSQAGAPLEKAKETMKYIVDRMNPNDTFNFMDFSNQARMLFSTPKKNTPETREKVLRYISSLKAGGGTRMIPAVWKALADPPRENRLRVVTFMTDGLVGNDFEVIAMVKKLREHSRWFPFGTGNSVNRYLLDNLARVGGGEADYILLNSPSEKVAKKFYRRIAEPVLTDIKLSFQGIELEEVYPNAVSDLWSQKPMVFKARYSKGGKGTIKITGFMGGEPYEQTLDVELPDKELKNATLKSLWARAKVRDLMDRDLMGIQRGVPRNELKEQIVKVALGHRIMTQFTSFVAVEEAVVTVGGKPTKVTVPVEMADGVSREGVSGKERKIQANMRYSTSSYVRTGMPKRRGSPSSYGSARGGRPLPTSHKDLMARNMPGKMGFGLSAPPPRRASRSVMTMSPPREEQAREDAASSLDKETVRIAALHRKLSKQLVAIVKMKDTPRNVTKGTLTIRDGKLVVQVWLTRMNESVLKKLEELGLRISFKASTGKLVIGEIAVGKLEELVKVEAVRRIEPFSTA